MWGVRDNHIAPYEKPPSKARTDVLNPRKFLHIGGNRTDHVPNGVVREDVMGSEGALSPLVSQLAQNGVSKKNENLKQTLFIFG